MTASELTPGVLAKVEKIKKLLNLAAKAGTPEEAASATAKAQEFLVEINFTAEMVERETTKDGRREQAAVDGGFYSYQRRLYRSVAELNFCVYWAQQYRVYGKRQIYETYYDESRGEERRRGVGQEMRHYMKTRHVIVGRVVNVRASIAMATYLSQAVERLTRERLPEETHRVSRWAVSFREGAVMTVAEKLEERRAVVLDEEEKREREAARMAEAGASTSTALTIAGFAKTEKEANLDFIHGEGYSARRAAERAKRAAQAAEEEAAYTAWAAANPEEVRLQREEDEKREKKNASRRRGRAYSGGADKTDWGAYRTGREAGRKIGLDAQVDSGRGSKIGGGK